MIFSKILCSRVAEILTETCSVIYPAIVLSTVTLCVFGTAQVAIARGLRPLIYQPDDAARTATAARLRDAEQKHQALKFDAPDLTNIEAKLFGTGYKSTAKGQKTGAVAPWNPVDALAAMVDAIVAPNALAQEAPGGPQVTGAWQTLPYLMPINPIHLNMLHNGNILITAGTENDPAEVGVSSKAAIWWLGTGTFTQWDNMPWDLFCNGGAALPDGRILTFGGTTQYDPFYGDARANIFDPAAPNYIPFNEVQSMADGRWYGSATVLGDGSIMAFSGWGSDGNINQTVEIYVTSQYQQGWTTPATAPFVPPLYPWMFLLPSNNVFYAAGGWGGAASVNGATSYDAEVFNPANETWTDSFTTYYQYDREYGSAVMLPLLPGFNYAPRIMIMGGDANGDVQGEATTEMINLGAPSPAWQPSGNMPSGGREEMNAVLFPNGKVLALGGSVVDEDPTTATLGADIYDSNTGTWTAGAPEVYPRLYHNSALLLPDGTVIVAGSNPVRGTYEQHIEIYTPPWLFDANGNRIQPSARLQITSAPATIGYGPATFQITSPNGAGMNVPNVSGVTLVKLGSDTHAFDFEQRVIGLLFTASSGTLTVNCPPTPFIAPPGYYMLFLLDPAGVPSVASFVQVINNPSHTPPKGIITSPPSDVVIQPGQSVNFTGTATDPDGTVTNLWWFFPGATPNSSTSPNTGPIVFPNQGVYVVSLTAVDNWGANDPSPPTRVIAVEPPQ